jgi:hypothetical protein
MAYLMYTNKNIWNISSRSTILKNTYPSTGNGESKLRYCHHITISIFQFNVDRCSQNIIEI